MSSIHLLFAICFMGGGQGRGGGRVGAKNYVQNLLFRKWVFSLKKRKRTLLCLQSKNLVIFVEYNLKAFFFDKLVKFKTDIVGGWVRGS